MTITAPGPSQTASPTQVPVSLVEVLTVIGPVGALTALFYYFGYASARAFYGHFGVSLDLVEFSVTGAAVLSVDTLFRPAATLILLLIAAFVAHQLVGRLLWRAGPGPSRFVALFIALVGAGLGVVGLLGLFGPLAGAASALCLAASVPLLEYALRTAARYGRPTSASDLAATGKPLRTALLVAVVLVAIFWAVTDLAVQRGRARADLFERSLPLQAQAVVYSDEDLQLGGPGVGTTAISHESTAYGFRYNGLRQLLHANGRWFLLPVGWRHDNGATVIVLPDDHGGSRVDLAP